MHFFNLLFLLFSLFLQTTIIFPTKKHRFKPFTTKVQRAAQVNKQLEQNAQKCDISKNQEIVRHAITHRGISPDALRVAQGDNCTPLFDCIVARDEKEGLPFAEFLLKRGANARAVHAFGREKRPLIFFAQTVAMAQLLVNHGAGKDIQDLGPKLLNDIWRMQQDAQLIPFFVAHGVRTDRTANGEVPLINLVELTSDQALEEVLNKARLVELTSDQALEEVLNKARLLMMHGAPLNLRRRGLFSVGDTAPKFIRREITAVQTRKRNSQDPEECDKSIARLQTIRQTLIDEEQKRNIRFCMHAIPWLIPPMRSIIGSYAGDYIELEAEGIDNNTCKIQLSVAQEPGVVL